MRMLELLKLPSIRKILLTRKVELTGEPDNLIDIEYEKLKQNLKQLVETTDPIHFAYFLRERDKSVLLSNLPGMAYRCNYDSNWTMKFVSDGCFDLTGYEPERLLHNRDLSFNDLISPEYRDLLKLEWERILPQRLSFKIELGEVRMHR